MSTETEERNKAILREVHERMVRRDMPSSTTSRLSETRSFFPRSSRRFPISRSIETIVAERRSRAIHAWYEGTHKGELMGYKPSGKRLKFQVVSVDRLEDGRIVQHNAEAGFARAIFQARH